MDAYEKIQEMVAGHYGKKPTENRKSIGDFFLDKDNTHAVNVKSNNKAKNNYSPNMVSIKVMHKWVYEQKKNLSFVFVDYREDDAGKITLEENSGEFKLIALEHIKWSCLSIEAQGYGVIQMNKKLEVDDKQTKKIFYEGFLEAYKAYIQKESKKHEKFSKNFLDPENINW